MSSGLIGREIGRYKILEQLGQGGMATVYKAHDSRLDRDVAIKVIRREAFVYEDTNVVLRRFEREAKSLASLSHPNIVRVLDYGEFEGTPFLVMEFLSGGTLKGKLGKPIPWREAVRLLLPVARALEFVHARNIINRDVKPSNILLTENGEPLLTDFGLVKLFTGQGKDTTSITVSGAGLGTPDYMAPEQWTGEATAQSDLYSLGVVLYEMITAHRPFAADTPAGILLKQASESLPLPKQYAPDLPQNVEAVMLKLLAKKPENRYANMTVVVNELENLLAGKQVSASNVKLEKLREQMTGVVEVEKPPAVRIIPPKPVVTPPNSPPYTPAEPPSYAPYTPSEPPSYAPAAPVFTPKRRNWTFPLIVVAVMGVSLLIGVIFGCWWLYANYDIFPTSPGQNPVGVSPTVLFSYQTATTAPEPALPPPTTAREKTAIPTEKALPEEITDEQGVPMRLVPAGEFSMGSDNSVDVASRPGHTVALNAFYIDKFEVTNELYAACVEAGACRRPKSPGSITRSTYFNDPRLADYPVLYLDWWMAKEFCAWRDARLPTEAEWEKAARGTDGRVYPWDSQERDCYYSNLAGCEADTSPVEAYEQGQSPYGVYDLSGNVWEWTSSLFEPYPYDPDDGRENQTGTGKRVLRGGSFHIFGVPSGTARSDTRFEMDPSYYGAYVGVRCARDVEIK